LLCKITSNQNKMGLVFHRYKTLNIQDEQ